MSRMRKYAPSEMAVVQTQFELLILQIQININEIHETDLDILTQYLKKVHGLSFSSKMEHYRELILSGLNFLLFE